MKLKLLFLFTLFYSLSIYAQEKATFKIIGNPTNIERLARNKRLDISKIKVENISNQPIYLEWETILNTFPKEWDCSMCQHGNCQIGIPKGSVFKKLQPDQQGFIAIHVIPKKHISKAIVQFKLYDKANPEYFEILTFNVETY